MKSGEQINFLVLIFVVIDKKVAPIFIFLNVVLRTKGKDNSSKVSSSINETPGSSSQYDKNYQDKMEY